STAGHYCIIADNPSESSSERALQSGWTVERGTCSMGDAVFRRESAVEYFKELVDGALSNQRVATRELTAFYVVQLLASFLQRDVAAVDHEQTPLAVRLGRALDAGGLQQRA